MDAQQLEAIDRAAAIGKRIKALNPIAGTDGLYSANWTPAVEAAREIRRRLRAERDELLQSVAAAIH